LNGIYKNKIKKILDVVLSIAILIFLSPIFLLICIVLTFANSGSPFFIQKRPGKKEVIFDIIKFKTMNDSKDENGNLLADAQRLTKIGKFIRSTSLDEFPQLLNVIKGEMSIVGPRPLLPQYLQLYNEFQKKRHDVKPGITGWAQINGRNAITWEEKFELDVYYVQNVTFVLDLKIVFKTVRKIFLMKDINNQDTVTMKEFKGTKF
jgi:undecaprenyl phosphate N,N'-diacetylbacillosamine 1-phosphate transferase